MPRPRRACPCAASETGLGSTAHLIEWDVVLYRQPRPKQQQQEAEEDLRLGLVTSISASSHVSVQPLVEEVSWSLLSAVPLSIGLASTAIAFFYVLGPMPPAGWQEESIWQQDDRFPTAAVELARLVRIVPVEYSQRQDKGPQNPHGEHAHDVFLARRERGGERAVAQVPCAIASTCVLPDLALARPRLAQVMEPLPNSVVRH
jgi:hypothetical protein